MQKEVRVYTHACTHVCVCCESHRGGYTQLGAADVLMRFIIRSVDVRIIILKCVSYVMCRLCSLNEYNFIIYHWVCVYACMRVCMCMRVCVCAGCPGDVGAPGVLARRAHVSHHQRSLRKRSSLSNAPAHVSSRRRSSSSRRGSGHKW